MMGYFKPLRRKFGVMTLVLACLFTAGWIRSRYYEDWGFVRLGNTFYLLQSHQGGFSYHKWPKPPPTGQWFGSRSVQNIAILTIGNAPRNHFFIHYSTSAILLTPLAAWLLLSKPRAKVEPALPEQKRL
jgi:hypothetical protein